MTGIKLDYIVEKFREELFQAMLEQTEVCSNIVLSTIEPTFENVIAALDRSGEQLRQIENIFNHLCKCNSTPELRSLQNELAPQLSVHKDSITLNEGLFVKVQKVWDKRLTLHLDEQEAAALEATYKHFKRNGALLDEDGKRLLAGINAELAALKALFAQRLLLDTNETIVSVGNIEELAGLSDAHIAAAKKLAIDEGRPDEWCFNMKQPSYLPVLQTAENRDLRRRVYEAYTNRGNTPGADSGRCLAEKIVRLRQQKAKLLGFANYAEYALERRMAKTPVAVRELLMPIFDFCKRKAKEELAVIGEEMQKDGLEGRPEAWDISFYLHKINKVRRQLDEKALKPYLDADNILEGAFHVAERLYGLHFCEQTEKLPSYAPNVKAWEVLDKDGSLLAYFYADYFPHKGKTVGAWNTRLRGQGYDDSGRRIPPIVGNVANLTPPTSGSGRALQSLKRVQTIFHEFGHALHNFMRNVRYHCIGTTELDFVEVPSKFYQQWALKKEVLKHYARHYVTGEPMPESLADNIEASASFGQGIKLVKSLLAALIDLDLHELGDFPKDFCATAFENARIQAYDVPDPLEPVLRTAHFKHTMCSGYAAGYYSYVWSDIMACSMFELFQASESLFNTELASKLRSEIFAKGGMYSGAQLYEAFAGEAPNPEAYLRHLVHQTKK